MKKLITTAVIIAFGFVASAQVSRYLDKDQSGISLRLGAEKTYGEYGLSVQAGGSIKGIIDIEASYTRSSYEGSTLDLLKGDANANLFEGWINWWVLRKSIIPAIDVNVGIWGEYANATYQNYYAADPSTYLYKNYQEGQFGFEVSINFRVTDTWWVQPDLFAYYAVGQEKWEENSQTVKNNYQGIGSSIGIGIVKRINKSSLYLQYNQYFDSYQASTNKYKLSIGYILGL